MMDSYMNFINNIQKKVKDAFDKELMNINTKMVIDNFLREIFKDNEYFYQFYDMSIDYDNEKNTVDLIPNNIETVALMFGIRKEDVTYIDSHNIETKDIQIFWNTSDIYIKLPNPLKSIEVRLETCK